MNTKIEAPVNHPARLALAKLAATLFIMPDIVRRSTVAAIVEDFGFGAFAGGCYVAVHAHKGTGEAAGARLAIITGTGPDWT